MVRAVIFDSDGTLLDSFEAIVGAYEHVAGVFGYTPPTAAMVREQLRHAPPLPAILKSFFPNEDVEELLRANNEYIISRFNDSVRRFEGLDTSLQRLRELGFKLAVVTGGNHKIQQVLEAHGIAQYFMSVVHCERVVKSKPDPEGFVLALEECGVLPHEAIMVGDSPTDIMAGKNGQAAATIGVTHGNASREDLVAADADYIVDSLPELCDLIERQFAED